MRCQHVRGFGFQTLTGEVAKSRGTFGGLARTELEEVPGGNLGSNRGNSNTQLVESMRANQLDEEAAAADYHLPVEAVREALVYVERNRELLETEAEIERLMLRREGVARGPQPVS